MTTTLQNTRVLGKTVYNLAPPVTEPGTQTLSTRRRSSSPKAAAGSSAHDTFFPLFPCDSTPPLWTLATSHKVYSSEADSVEHMYFGIFVGTQQNRTELNCCPTHMSKTQY
ncbi:unnamed protein product [Periconia digitata]|uniref:Uncharacterized protein n=1 Tax=Periconia digitata TaxID=1303443 RepID=A0A9W4U5H3_9PLEO|nr:unnamed protein product [Periconia digitata]